jgi:C4-dicarboxylate transporter
MTKKKEMVSRCYSSVPNSLFVLVSFRCIHFVRLQYLKKVKTESNLERTTSFEEKMVPLLYSLLIPLCILVFGLSCRC